MATNVPKQQPNSPAGIDDRADTGFGRRSDETLDTSSPNTALTWRCNICGEWTTGSIAELGRETASCGTCGSTARWRAVIHVLSMELFGTALALPDFPDRPDIKGIGLSDWHGYASRLASKLGYQNTYYDTEPRLDIASVDSFVEGSCDFVIASDVFEHVAPPVSQAFRNLCRLLRPDGVAIFTVPYGKTGRTIEHFPDLHDYTILETDGRLVLRNITKAGVLQIFDTLTFHGEPGSTLEMRQFSEGSLIEQLHEAGFSTVQTYPARHLEHGIYWPEDWGLAMALRPARTGRRKTHIRA